MIPATDVEVDTICIPDEPAALSDAVAAGGGSVRWLRSADDRERCVREQCQ
jgi:hypothetical protein